MWAKPCLFFKFVLFSIQFNEKYGTQFDNKNVDSVLGIRIRDPGW